VETGCTTIWIYLTLLNYTSKIIDMLNIMCSVSHYIIKILILIYQRKKNVDSGLWEVKFIIFDQHFVPLNFKKYLVNFFSY